MSFKRHRGAFELFIVQIYIYTNTHSIGVLYILQFPISSGLCPEFNSIGGVIFLDFPLCNVKHYKCLNKAPLNMHYFVRSNDAVCKKKIKKGCKRGQICCVSCDFLKNTVKEKKRYFLYALDVSIDL